MGQRLFSRC